MRPSFRPAARSASSAWTWSFDMAPARSAWLRSPPEAQASMSSTRMRARRMRAGAISCFSGLSAPTAATKHPLKSKSSVRIGDFDVVQVIQMSSGALILGARQVHIWLRDEGIELPVKSRDGEARGIVWRLPAYNIVHNILTNPIYAGAYAFGRTTSKVSVEQRAQAREAWRASADGRVGCSDQGSSRGPTSPGMSSRGTSARSPTTRPAKAAPRLRERYGAESCCWPDFCAVVIAAASCMCPTVAKSAATAAMGPARTTARSAASRSAA
jgi:Recombinase